MKAKNMGNAQISTALGIDNTGSWHKVNIFGEPVNKCINCIVPFGCLWQTNNKIHGDMLPGLTVHRLRYILQAYGAPVSRNQLHSTHLPIAPLVL